MDQIRLAIADSAPIYLKALDATLSKEKKFNVVVKADNGLVLMQSLLYKKVDIVLLETTLPGQNGLECLAEIREKNPSIKIIMLSIEDNEETIRTCMSMGACSYLSKIHDEKKIIKAIKEIHLNGTYIDEYLTRVLSKSFSPVLFAKELASHTGIYFSPRDITIIQMICREMTSEDIAASLNYSKRSIDTYRNNIIKRIGCRSIAGVVAFAIKNKLVYC